MQNAKNCLDVVGQMRMRSSRMYAGFKQLPSPSSPADNVKRNDNCLVVVGQMRVLCVLGSISTP